MRTRAAFHAVLTLAMAVGCAESQLIPDARADRAMTDSVVEGGDVSFDARGDAQDARMDSSVPTDATDAADAPDGFDTGRCDPPRRMCGADCVDTMSDSMHCGACAMACPSDRGCVAGMCVPASVRLLGPMSTSYVSSRRPRLRWALQGASTGAEVELCRDRACTMTVATLRGTTDVRPAGDLAAGTYYWRARAMRDVRVIGATTPTWQFRVHNRSAAVDTANGAILDVNGDGFGDVAVGAPGATAGARSGAGLVYVYYGSATGVARMAARTLEGAIANGAFGTSVASAGDVNGDGFGDLLVGSPMMDFAGRANAGAVHVFLGSATGLAMTADRVIEGTAGAQRVGASVAGLGDIDGDGYGDIAAGAPMNTTPGRSAAGSLNVYLGSAMGVVAMAHRTIFGDQAAEHFGTSVGAAGDVNGDGFADVIAGAPDADRPGLTAAGTARVYFGSAMGLTMMPHRTFDGSVSGQHFGAAVNGVGDLDGDGYADVGIGAPQSDVGMMNAAGRIFVHNGSATGLPMMPTRTLNGTTSGGAFGTALARAGDVNNDGFDDLMGSAPEADLPGRLNAGYVAVFLGSSGGVAMMSAAGIYDGAQGDRTGSGIASAGDLNGDGFDDVIVGARQADPMARLNAGAARVYHGSTTGLDGAPDATFGGAVAGDLFGTSVALRWDPMRVRLFPG